MNKNFRYAAIDGRAVRYSDTEAWWFVRDAWKALDVADAFSDARVLSEAEYKAMFPDLPNLPEVATA